MYGGLTRNQVRSFFYDSWRRRANPSLLSPLEEVAVDWIVQHPEYHALFEDQHKSIEKEYTPEHGELNPFLHLSMHLSISEQVAADSPRGIKDMYYNLINNTQSEHEAAHRIMDCLGEAIWTSQRTNRPLDTDTYMTCIKKLSCADQVF
jgi:hypothetical protein